jgi:hypothetical protein
MTVPYLKVAQTHLQVAIHPSETAHPLDGVRRQLNSLLFKFNQSLDGIPLSYSDLQLAPGKENGRFMADQPWIHIDVFSSVVVFKPIVGSKVNGKITKVRWQDILETILHSSHSHLNTGFRQSCSNLNLTAV